jgi:hypothetical protein
LEWRAHSPALAIFTNSEEGTVGAWNPDPGNAESAASRVGMMGRCQVCGNTRQTSEVKFHYNIGMIVLRQTRSIQGNMCKTCMRSKYWEYMGKNLLLGPWGIISVIVTPIYMVTNTVTYMSGTHKLSGALE